MNTQRVWLTSMTSLSSLVKCPDQKTCAQVATLRHWSGFLRSREEDMAQLDLRVSWFSSPRLDSCSRVAIIRVMAACWARESVTSSSYRVKA